MKRLIGTILAAIMIPITAATSSEAHHFNDESVLKTGRWVRVSVAESGIYKITYENLVSWGLSVTSSPKVYGYGGGKLAESFKEKKTDDLPQQNVWIEKGSDGVFNAGDYILFYAQGPVTWSYDGGKFTHTRNPYSDYGYYFVTTDTGKERYINDSIKPSATGTPTHTLTTFTDYALHEEELRSIIKSGQEWYGEEFTNSSEEEFDFDMPNISTGTPMKVTVAAITESGSQTSMTGRIGTRLQTYTLQRKPSDYAAYESKNTREYTAETDEIEFYLRYNGSSGGTGWLNYIELNATRRLTMNGSYMTYRNPTVTGEECVRYELSGEEGIEIWDITDPLNIKRIETAYENGIYSYNADETTMREYAAVRTGRAFASPTKTEDVANQNLHSIKDADLVIITADEYMPYAEQIADLHSEKDGISTLVVTPQQVYNEYSSGTPDATSYRWLVKSMYDRTEGKKPQNLMLMGDATYDHRGYERENLMYNKVLTYESQNSLHTTTQSYATDDYFGMIGDETGGNLLSDPMSIGVGRLPISTEEQAETMVRKISAYMKDTEKGSWKNRMVYIADDDNDSKLCYTWQSDTLANRIEKNHKEMQVTRLFTDAYTKVVTSNSVSYPEVNKKLLEHFKNGALFMDYTGHGSTEGLAAEKFFDRSDIAGLTNKKYPYFFTATCDFTDFDKPTQSGGEDLILKEDGGAIALYSACRTVYASDNFTLNKNFHDVFLKRENGKPITFGEAFRQSKNKTSGHNKLSYILMGDPALRFPLPTRQITVDSVKEIRTVQDGRGEYVNEDTKTDTLKALSTIRIAGRVMDEAGSEADATFDGEIDVTVMDKEKNITTLGNDESKGEPTHYTYKDRVNTIYKGKAEVKAGKYEVVFLVPKDIAYDYGKGRVSLYAKNTEEDIEATGYSNDVTVGGTNDEVEYEENAPKLSMYINSPSFKSGSKIDQSSILYATLTDENGINTTGSGIGHDIQLRIEGDTTLTMTLNEYYENDMGTYKSGRLRYTLPELNAGKYTATLRVWDLMNNSATETLAFSIDTDKRTGVYSMKAYPNPVDRNGTLNFEIEHDQPETEMTFRIEIYDASGNRQYREERKSYSEDSKSTLSVNIGGMLKPGSYVYRIWTGTDENGKNAKTDKLIVK